MLLFATLVLVICFVSILCPIESERPCPELLYIALNLKLMWMASVCHNLLARLIFKPLGFVFPELAITEYQHRHDKAASYLHWNICKELNINVEEKWYEHEPQTVTERDNITILWDMPIQTDREIKANRPDILIKDKQEKSSPLIDMSIPTEKNTSVKVTEKLSKYKDLEIEIERMWGMKATMIPVVIGALGLIKKGLEKNTKQIPGNIKISELQKIALLGTSHILRKTLSIKTSTSF